MERVLAYNHGCSRSATSALRRTFDLPFSELALNKIEAISFGNSSFLTPSDASSDVACWHNPAEDRQSTSALP
jgi:hypothetical protein